MFIYLSKKIAIPNNIHLRCLSWNKEHGYIACGGEDGLLRVLKLEAGKDGTVKGLAAPSNLSMNQTLDGHSGPVEVVVWNEKHQKLTSSDENGLIKVWMLYKGSWFEEMINNRNKSFVKGMAWSAEGNKICIVYEDGCVIVGSVDGNRIWGKDIKGGHLSCVEWSPDGKMLLFGMRNGEVHIYDRGGSMVTKLNVQCLSGAQSSSELISIDWYKGLKGYAEPNCPCLLVAYSNGRLQIMRNENDLDPVLMECGLIAIDAKWNHNGSIFAVAGQMVNSDNTHSNLIQFYTFFGQHIYSLKIPGKNIQAVTWEEGGLRIAVAVDCYIYFANIRPSYKWCYFANTVVYSYVKQEKEGTSIVFYNIETNEKHTKIMKHLLLMASCKDHCVLVSKNEDAAEKYALVLSNAIGIPIESRLIDMIPLFVTMNHNSVICASKECFYVWNYKSPKDKTLLDLTAGLSMHKRVSKERIYHVDDSPSGIEDANPDLTTSHEPTNDPISCICASDKRLIIARFSGIIQNYDLPHVILSNRYNFFVRSSQIQLNCNSTIISIIDVNGLLTLYNLEGKSKDQNGREMPGVKLNFERKDIWDVKWATDNPDMLAVMEKTRMYIFKKLEPEEPVLCSGYICCFEDLLVKTIFLDDILNNPENPSKNDVMNIEAKTLRDARQILSQSTIEEASKFIEENSYSRLWKLLAEAALRQLDFNTAENAFVRCKDYQGILFVKRLANLQNETLKKAEINAFFKEYDQAEKIYLDIDRKDLAISLRQKLGDWFRVIELLKMGGGIRSGIDLQMEEALNAVGDYNADRQNWEVAVTYYEQGRNQDRLVECYYMLEDYDKLEELASELPENHSLLIDLGNKFSAVGMCPQAVDAYVKAGKVKTAVDCCINLNQWNLAINLARKHNMKEISSLLNKYAKHLMEENNFMQAIELYRMANMSIQGAQLAFKLAKQQSAKKLNPVIMKKLYLLAALLVEDHHNTLQNTSNPVGSAHSGKASAALANMLEEDSVLINDQNINVLDQAWKGVEAYHFYVLAQKQLHKGHINDATKTSIQLREYEEFINPQEIYSILALSSSANHSFGTCSKAFIKLESLIDVTEETRRQYEELAMEIFARNPPKDSQTSRAECLHCETLIPDWCSICPSCSSKFPICIASGKPIHESNPWSCIRCTHHAYQREIISKFRACPLCYHLIPDC